MFDYASPTALRLRRFGQRLGVLRPATRLYRRFMGSAYEETFDRMLATRIRPGDVVWDIGANVGYYTIRFADAAGPTGHVVAFEPGTAYTALVKAVGDRPNVTLMRTALADYDGEATFYAGKDAQGVNDSLAGDGPGERVRVACGDTFTPKPTVLKIDVEGFEPEVLAGLSATLANSTLRDVFVEVHFLELARRGLKDAPTRIVRQLQTAGFAVRWTDPSHIFASRAP